MKKFKFKLFLLLFCKLVIFEVFLYSKVTTPTCVANDYFKYFYNNYQSELYAARSIVLQSNVLGKFTKQITNLNAENVNYSKELTAISNVAESNAVAIQKKIDSLKQSSIWEKCAFSIILNSPEALHLNFKLYQGNKLLETIFYNSNEKNIIFLERYLTKADLGAQFKLVPFVGTEEVTLENVFYDFVGGGYYINFNLPSANVAGNPFGYSNCISVVRVLPKKSTRAEVLNMVEFFNKNNTTFKNKNFCGYWCANIELDIYNNTIYPSLKNIQVTKSLNSAEIDSKNMYFSTFLAQTIPINNTLLSNKSYPAIFSKAGKAINSEFWNNSKKANNSKYFSEIKADYNQIFTKVKTAQALFLSPAFESLINSVEKNNINYSNIFENNKNLNIKICNVFVSTYNRLLERALVFYKKANVPINDTDSNTVWNIYILLINCLVKKLGYYFQLILNSIQTSISTKNAINKFAVEFKNTLVAVKTAASKFSDSVEKQAIKNFYNIFFNNIFSQLFLLMQELNCNFDKIKFDSIFLLFDFLFTNIFPNLNIKNNALELNFNNLKTKISALCSKKIKALQFVQFSNQSQTTNLENLEMIYSLNSFLYKFFEKNNSRKEQLELSLENYNNYKNSLTDLADFELFIKNNSAFYLKKLTVQQLVSLILEVRSLLVNCYAITNFYKKLNDSASLLVINSILTKMELIYFQAVLKYRWNAFLEEKNQENLTQIFNNFDFLKNYKVDYLEVVSNYFINLEALFANVTNVADNNVLFALNNDEINIFSAIDQICSLNNLIESLASINKNNTKLSTVNLKNKLDEKLIFSKLKKIATLISELSINFNFIKKNFSLADFSFSSVKKAIFNSIGAAKKIDAIFKKYPQLNNFLNCNFNFSQLFLKSCILLFYSELQKTDIAATSQLILYSFIYSYSDLLNKDDKAFMEIKIQALISKLDLNLIFKNYSTMNFTENWKNLNGVLQNNVFLDAIAFMQAVYLVSKFASFEKLDSSIISAQYSGALQKYIADYLKLNLKGKNLFNDLFELYLQLYLFYFENSDSANIQDSMHLIFNLLTNKTNGFFSTLSKLENNFLHSNLELKEKSNLLSAINSNIEIFKNNFNSQYFYLQQLQQFFNKKLNFILAFKNKNNLINFKLIFPAVQFSSSCNVKNSNFFESNYLFDALSILNKKIQTKVGYSEKAALFAEQKNLYSMILKMNLETMQRSKVLNEFYYSDFGAQFYSVLAQFTPCNLINFYIFKDIPEYFCMHFYNLDVPKVFLNKFQQLTVATNSTYSFLENLFCYLYLLARGISTNALFSKNSKLNLAQQKALNFSKNFIKNLKNSVEIGFDCNKQKIKTSIALNKKTNSIEFLNFKIPGFYAEFFGQPVAFKNYLSLFQLVKNFINIESSDSEILALLLQFKKFLSTAIINSILASVCQLNVEIEAALKNFKIVKKNNLEAYYQTFKVEILDRYQLLIELLLDSKVGLVVFYKEFFEDSATFIKQIETLVFNKIYPKAAQAFNSFLQNISPISSSYAAILNDIIDFYESQLYYSDSTLIKNSVYQNLGALFNQIANYTSNFKVKDSFGFSVQTYYNAALYSLKAVDFFSKIKLEKEANFALLNYSNFLSNAALQNMRCFFELKKKPINYINSSGATAQISYSELCANFNNFYSNFLSSGNSVSVSQLNLYKKIKSKYFYDSLLYLYISTAKLSSLNQLENPALKNITKQAQSKYNASETAKVIEFLQKEIPNFDKLNGADSLIINYKALDCMEQILLLGNVGLANFKDSIGLLSNFTNVLIHAIAALYINYYEKPQSNSVTTLEAAQVQQTQFMQLMQSLKAYQLSLENSNFFNL